MHVFELIYVVNKKCVVYFYYCPLGMGISRHLTIRSRFRGLRLDYKTVIDADSDSDTQIWVAANTEY